MKLLAIDTATEACSVALNINGEVTEHFELLPRRHSRELLPMIEQILGDAGLAIGQIDALVFGRGPGAFTGLRVATAMAQGLAFAADIPVIPVSTLAALAQQGYRLYGASQVLSAIDARMDEVYWGAFSEKAGLMALLDDEQVLAPEAVTLPNGLNDQWLGMGTGWLYQDRLAVTVTDSHKEALPHALDMALLAAADFREGRMLPAEEAMPVYLRDKVALTKRERQGQ
ncbi:tRNA (adenosine(37)-N6)-threonylcarbamoyltransferase complex dimerization subunit type 1 TsaB [Endozoicomonas sp. Mp262]|uniref:tRNA (adenosine(37)-N6)-threonylcarbamoyltransferase complex dimerization subunit type 1 TsaB n=1 Tax=Endozoicomonas sp. Mp262 TaxID=2919499 RepID=UPI0021DF763F